MKVWMLTGDKAETAMCIGRAARLCEYNQEILVVQGANEHEVVMSLQAASAAAGFGLAGALQSRSTGGGGGHGSGFGNSIALTNLGGSGSSSSSGSSHNGSSNSGNNDTGGGASFSTSRPAILIDGASLALALVHAESTFMELALDAPAVICCRCSPLQKAQIVTLARQYSGGKRCAAIGDGGANVICCISRVFCNFCAYRLS